LALGAQRRDVLRMVVGRGIVLALVGAGIGVAISLGMTRYLGSLLYGVSATDPWTFAGVAALLTIVALVACYIPARKATRTDPTASLRYE
jgi:ABC-type antimicrobial peptide transport system permease subunit